MASLVRFLLFASVLIALLVVVVLPLVAGPVATGLLRAAGFGGDGLSTQIQANGLTLLGGRADRVQLQGRAVDVAGARIGSVDLTLHGVSLVERTFARVDGDLRDIRIATGTGETLTVASMDVAGPSQRAAARGHVDVAESKRLITKGAARAGLDVAGVQLRDGRITLRTRGGRTSEARLLARDGALILVSAGRDVALTAPDPAGAWQMTGVTVSAGGVTIDGVIDAQALARRAAASGD